jgi:hypothetical protein
LDANGDGAITKAESDAARAARREKGEEKRAAKKAEMLSRYDADGNGEMDEAERAAARAERGAEREAKRAERGDRGDRKAKRGDRPKLDANADGFISQAEYLDMADTLFTRMDANGDGQLVKGEGRKRGKKGKRGKRGGRR